MEREILCILCSRFFNNKVSFLFTTHPPVYYMNLKINNIGSKAIEFNFTPDNGRLIQLPAGSSALLNATMDNISPPAPVDLSIRETVGQVVDTFLVKVEWLDSSDQQTLNLGNGQGSVSTSGMSHYGSVPSNDAAVNSPVGRSMLFFWKSLTLKKISN